MLPLENDTPQDETLTPPTPADGQLPEMAAAPLLEESAPVPEPTPESDASAAPTTEPSKELNEILERIDVLQHSFDSKIRYDASKERIIDSLHAELQAYRDGLHAKILRPVFFDLISMHDDLSNLLRYNSAIAQEANEVAFRLRQNLVSFQQSIEAILEKHGAQVYTEPGEAYSAQRQRALRTEPTEDAAKDRLICERLRKGFEYEGKVLRPEIVVIYKYTGSTNQPTKEM